MDPQVRGHPLRLRPAAPQVQRHALPHARGRALRGGHRVGHPHAHRGVAQRRAQRGAGGVLHPHRKRQRGRGGGGQGPRGEDCEGAHSGPQGVRRPPGCAVLPAEGVARREPAARAQAQGHARAAGDDGGDAGVGAPGPPHFKRRGRAQGRGPHAHHRRTCLRRRACPKALGPGHHREGVPAGAQRQGGHQRDQRPAAHAGRRPREKRPGPRVR